MNYHHDNAQASPNSPAFYDFRKDFDSIARPGLLRYQKSLGYGTDEPDEPFDDCWAAGNRYACDLWKSLRWVQETMESYLEDEPGDAHPLSFHPGITTWSRESAMQYAHERLERELAPPAEPDEPIDVYRAVHLGTEMAREEGFACEPEAIAYAADRLKSKIERDAVENAEVCVYEGIRTYYQWMKPKQERLGGGKVVYIDHYKRRREWREAELKQAEARFEQWFAEWQRAGRPSEAEERAQAEQNRTAGEKPRAESKSGDGDPLAGVQFDEGGVAAPEPMLIRRLLPRSGIGMLGGQSGVGKSFLMCEGATRLAVGGEFFGHPVYERVGSLILAAEGAATMQNRITLSRQMATEMAKLPIAWIGNVPNLSDQKEVRKLAARVERVKDRFLEEFGVRLGVIWIDTLAAAARFENENDNSEVERVADNLRLLADLSASFAMATHHYGKDQETGLRGASANRAVCDVVWSAIGNRDQLTGKISGRKFALAKSRSDEEGLISGFELKFKKLGVNDHGHDFGSCYIEPGKQGEERDTPWSDAAKLQKQLLEAYHDLACDVADSIVFGRSSRPVRKVHKDAIRDRLKSRGYLGDSDPQVPLEEKDRKRFDRARETVVEKHGLVEKDGFLWLPK
jgi:hypothetical protein